MSRFNLPVHELRVDSLSWLILLLNKHRDNEIFRKLFPARVVDRW